MSIVKTQIGFHQTNAGSELHPLTLSRKGDLHGLHRRIQGAYACASRRGVVALKNDGSVWWWGEIITTSAKNIEDTKGVSYTEPEKMLDDAIYVTCGDFSIAAIKEDARIRVFMGALPNLEYAIQPLMKSYNGSIYLKEHSTCFINQKSCYYLKSF